MAAETAATAERTVVAARWIRMLICSISSYTAARGGHLSIS
jgi:hypothetical protein